MNQIQVIGIILGIFLLAWMAWGWYVTATSEATPYTVLQDLGSNIEVRQYEKQTIITATADSDNSAFSPLGNYIFGGNAEGEKIAMTTPVYTEIKDDVVEMSFILPEGYTPENAPEPQTKRVSLSTLGARKIAALRFSGYAPESTVNKKTALLLQTLEKEGIKTIGNPMVWYYNDPGTPPFMRRNEVAIEVK